MQISIHIAPTFLWAQPEPISKKIADIEATSAEHTEDVGHCFSKICTAVTSLYLCATQSLPTGATCRMGLKEKKWERRGTFGVGRVFEDRTRESFHLWSINAERLRHHLSNVFARQDTSSLLPWILCTMFHTS